MRGGLLGFGLGISCCFIPNQKQWQNTRKMPRPNKAYPPTAKLNKQQQQQEQNSYREHRRNYFTFALILKANLADKKVNGWDVAARACMGVGAWLVPIADVEIEGHCRKKRIERSTAVAPVMSHGRRIQ